MTLLILVMVVGIVIAVVQSDLGSTGVIVAMIAMMAFIAGLPFKRIVMISVIILIGTVLVISATPYRRERLTTYLHPDQNCLGSGLQACQALIAVGSGGTIGLGLGRSVEAYGYLPESGNDSIFAIYGEKFGFIGSIVLLALFVALFSRLKNIIERAPDDFSRLVVVGVLAWISVQTLINIGAMIGLLPLKGITLPFISYGGTSVVFIMAAMGLVFQVSRHTSYNLPIANKAEGNYRDNNHTDRRRLGGHITPLLAVAHELKRIEPDCKIVYIGQRGDDFIASVANNSDIDASYTIRAGKFRRYHAGKLKQLFDLPTIAKNIRDIWRVLVGKCQSWYLLRKIKPDIIFIKGAYVGAPVGLAAAWLHIPYVTHDADAIPGLANRIIARWASAHAVALPKKSTPGIQPQKLLVLAYR